MSYDTAHVLLIIYNHQLTITCTYIEHKGKEHLLLQSSFNAAINNIYRQINFVKYSNTYKSWYMPKNKDLLQQLVYQTKGIAQVDISKLKLKPQEEAAKIAQQHTPVQNGLISSENAKQLQLFIQTLILKSYSQATINTYKNEFAVFLQTLKEVNAQSLTTQRIKDYLQYCHSTLKLTESTIHSRMNALKFYYEQVLYKEKFFWEIPRPKKPFQLPRFFNKEEIAAIINATDNLKHKVMLMLTYSGGLRVSEVVSLKTYNVDSRRMCIFITNAKGKKDRMVALSPVLLVMLREYARLYKIDKKEYLFQGQIKGNCYSIRSLQLVLNAAKQKANIMKPGGVHALRHSFATHLVDKGTDISMLQKLLGHNDIKTTLRYIHVSNKDLIKVLSPLDDLNIR